MGSLAKNVSCWQILPHLACSRDKALIVVGLLVEWSRVQYWTLWLRLYIFWHIPPNWLSLSHQGSVVGLANVFLVNGLLGGSKWIEFIKLSLWNLFVQLNHAGRVLWWNCPLLSRPFSVQVQLAGYNPFSNCFFALLYITCTTCSIGGGSRWVYATCSSSLGGALGEWDTN